MQQIGDANAFGEIDPHFFRHRDHLCRAVADEVVVIRI
jgi:hypothetical protein